MIICHTRGGGGRGGLKFVTKKWFYFLKASLIENDLLWKHCLYNIFFHFCLIIFHISHIIEILWYHSLYKEEHCFISESTPRVRSGLWHHGSCKLHYWYDLYVTLPYFPLEYHSDELHSNWSNSNSNGNCSAGILFYFNLHLSFDYYYHQSY